MVKFGNYLRNYSRQEWADQYIAYELLKEKLYEVVAARDCESEKCFLDARKHIFQGSLDDQVRKVLYFYSQRRELLLIELERTVSTGLFAPDDSDAAPAIALNGLGYRVEQDELSNMPSPNPHAPVTEAHAASSLEVRDIISRLHWLASELKWLLQYVSLNMQAIRKIVKKYAKHIDAEEPHPGHLVLEIGHPHDAHWKRLQASYLPADTADLLRDMQQHFDLRQAMETVQQCIITAQHLLACGSSKHSGTGVEDDCSTLLIDLDNADELIKVTRSLRDVENMEREAQREAQYVEPIGWRYEHQAGVFEPPPRDHEASATLRGLALNCLSCMLYMANYNVLLPFMEDISRHLHSSVSSVDSLVGMADLANLFGTVVYSFWTNHTFKVPLVVSCLLCLASNAVLLVGYHARSCDAMLAARFVLGCGSARSINRRYIADFVSRANRTKASLGFVCASTIGMALGPLLAMPLSHLPRLTLLSVELSPVVISGVLFLGLWLITAIWCALGFQEPRVLKTRVDTHGPKVFCNGVDNPLRHPLLEGMGVQSAATPVVAVPPPQRGLGLGGVLFQRGLGLGGVLFQRGLGLGGVWHNVRPCWPPLLLCLLSLMMLKTFQQSYSAGLPLLCGALLGWDSAAVGLYMGGLGVIVMPINLMAGYLSPNISDRALILASLSAALAGLGAMTQAAKHVWMYLCGGIVMLSGTVVWEGAAMSLMSKVMPSSLARGVLNAGLLTTEAGTIGRYCGNAVLAVMSAVWLGHSQSLHNIHKFSLLVHGLLAGMAGALLLAVMAMYKAMRA